MEDDIVRGAIAAEREPVVGGSCPGCGLASEDWTDPVRRDEETYCCTACATGGRCSCVEPELKEDSV